jgi:phage terminase small subunit
VPARRSAKLEALLAELNQQQQDFVEEYLAHGVGYKAYIVAYGPLKTKNGAEARASLLLRNVKVAACIAYARAERAKRIGISPQRILDEYAALAFARMPDVAHWGAGEMALVPSDELDDADAAAIKKVTQTEKFIKVIKQDKAGTEILMSRELTLELHAKQAALDKLAALEGVTPPADRTDPKAPGGRPDDFPAKEYPQGLLDRLPKATATGPTADDDSE